MSRLPECRWRGGGREFLQYREDMPVCRVQPRNRGLLCLHPKCTRLHQSRVRLSIYIARCRACLDLELCPEGWC